ncbi:UNVERIFIED_ORG: hypothetical protein [Escherichia phage CMSTMSU]
MLYGISDEMLDTVPRFMNHPYEENGVEKKFMPIIPVAYCARKGRSIL